MLKNIYRYLRFEIYKKKWALKNRNNYTKPLKYYSCKNILVGEGSYGDIGIEYWGAEKEGLIIGNYVSIASGVKFILGGNHNIDTLTTYPLKVKKKIKTIEATTKGEIVVEDDVWIGMNSIILSGITIGKGAVIALGTIVTKNVPPYSIYGGNPGRVLKYRFSNEIINKIKNVDLKKILKNKNIDSIDIFYEKLTEDNVDIILKKLNG